MRYSRHPVLARRPSRDSPGLLANHRSSFGDCDRVRFPPRDVKSRVGGSEWRVKKTREEEEEENVRIEEFEEEEGQRGEEGVNEGK